MDNWTLAYEIATDIKYEIDDRIAMGELDIDSILPIIQNKLDEYIENNLDYKHA